MKHLTLLPSVNLLKDRQIQARETKKIDRQGVKDQPAHRLKDVIIHGVIGEISPITVVHKFRHFLRGDGDCTRSATRWR